MNVITNRVLLLIIVVCFFSACAQIIPPTGGARDVTPPKLISVTPKDSQLQNRVTKIEMRFDEFIKLNNPLTEVTTSPILPFPLDVSVNKHTVTIKIPDSLLTANTTYRIAFGKAIQDVHEGNIFSNYNYIFSTGSYFDSLELNGTVYNAATGLRDTGALVMLYDAQKSDSAVVREKPTYAVTASNGSFSFKGLPDKAFRIYALRDGNNNMVYDGGSEMIAFSDSAVRPSNKFTTPIQLNIFLKDTSGNMSKGQDRAAARSKNTESFNGLRYTVAIDTSDIKHRTAEITKPIEIDFNKEYYALNTNRINLSYDSAGVTVEAITNTIIDTSKKNSLYLSTNWKENTVYVLRLLKGFVKDSSGNEILPSRYSFRTKRDEDYAKLHIHLPSKYLGDQYLFVLLHQNDTVYQRPVKDTMIHFERLSPGNYTMRVIVDKNKNRKWDSGDLLKRMQPEVVIPYKSPINLKSGWENMIDFEQEEKHIAN